jgi:enoyl-[acyl-carrier protein] reductase I
MPSLHSTRQTMSDMMDVGFTCAFLATPYARRVSGETMYVDGDVNIMA